MAIVGFALAALALLVFVFAEKDGQNQTMLLGSIALGIVSLLLCHILLECFDSGDTRPSGFARIGGIVAIASISLCVLMILVALSKKVAGKAADILEETPVEAANHLSGTSYTILGIVFVLIVFGLGWCFWKALGAAAKNEPEQQPGA